MALIKTTTFKGVTAEYWTVMNISTNKPNNITNVTLRLYLDEDVRQGNVDDFLDSMDVTLTGYNLALDDMYPLIKEAHTARDTFEEVTEDEVTTTVRVPFFSTATDDN